MTTQVASKSVTDEMKDTIISNIETGLSVEAAMNSVGLKGTRAYSLGSAFRERLDEAIIKRNKSGVGAISRGRTGSSKLSPTTPKVHVRKKKTVTTARVAHRTAPVAHTPPASTWKMPFHKTFLSSNVGMTQMPSGQVLMSITDNGGTDQFYLIRIEKVLEAV